MKTRLYNFDPLKPHFYIVKLGFTGVYIIFLILLKNTDCGYSLEPPDEAVLTSTHNLCFEQEFEKYQNFLFKIFPFLVVKFSIYLNRRVFEMNYMPGEKEDLTKLLKDGCQYTAVPDIVQGLHFVI